MKTITHQQFQQRIARKFVTMTEYCGAFGQVTVKCVDCGNIRTAKAMHIMYKVSCKKCDSLSRVKHNEIIADHGEWLEVDVSTAANKQSIMLIDRPDYDRIKAKYTGRILARQTNTLYAVTKMSGKMYIVHRLVLGTDKIIDHINHNGLDNRRCNLRACEHYQNMRNRVIQKNNKSGYAGVKLCRNSWLATISDGKGAQIYLGQYKKKADAVAARAAAEKEYYGEYRRMA